MKQTAQIFTFTFAVMFLTSLPMIKAQSQVIPASKAQTTGTLNSDSPLPQHIKSIRVILADILPTEELIKNIKATYEPYGIRLVFGRPSDQASLKEDAVLVATYYEEESFMSKTLSQSSSSFYMKSFDYTVSYLWLDLKQQFSVIADSVSGQWSSYRKISNAADLVAPMFHKDLSNTLQTSEITEEGLLGALSSGVSSDDGRYLFELQNGELLVSDVSKNQIVERRAVKGKELFVHGSVLCLIGEKGLMIFNISQAPKLSEPILLFDAQKVSNVLFTDRFLLALVDQRICVISTESSSQPRIVFSDTNPTEAFWVSQSGRLWMRVPKPKEDSQPLETNIQTGKIELDGKIKTGPTIPLARLGNEKSFAIGDNVAVGFTEGGHNLRLIDLRGTQPKLVSTVEGITVMDVALYGDIFAVLDNPVVRIYSGQDLLKPSHIADIPLNHKLPLYLPLIFGGNLPELTSLLRLGAAFPSMRLVKDTIVVRTSGLNLVLSENKFGIDKKQPTAIQIHQVKLAVFKSSNPTK